ncbi:hypothetical protein QYE76_067088 [Lolium multiflorum]|uniref:Transposase (putative) gypsy type domain-containing protein n=1 Tax=Lolium multiflorum TaxID=4521 RepID=A0AAD8SCV7_LOLMU|nr:hypothetical protein QYE76_067088 [Lolium multiflorum]
MAAKVLEAEQKKASKARNREGEKGQWWPCEVTDSDLRAFEKEGMIALDWSFHKDSVTPKPDPEERVFTKAWVERGLSLPCSEFFLSVLSTYGLQTHNICPNAYLLLSNFVTLCEGHLGIRPDIRLWQFFFRVKKETKDKAMNAGWFYVKNIAIPSVHEGLPKFINKPPEELASWSFIPALAQFPELDKATSRISWLVHDGLTGMDLTLSWFTRRIQPLKYNKQLICAYSRVEDQLRVTRDNLPTDSLNKRIRMLVKILRGQEVLEINKDIFTDNKCPPLNTLAEEHLRNVIRTPTSAKAAKEDPEDDDEEEEQAPKKLAPRTAKRPRVKVSGSDAGASGEASA